ncbi:lanthionine synthetase LanC family protein [Hymenobacter metallilatus]|uniref:Lanthionine synthetase n=1 Tax=Hymenobacter metallilatus TaxID=2493666 RepID=A0A3R9MD62_9BACT|nr:lanthionine synthetase LanC family protein [Hymenobacter metallilatus]RSK37522.1 hypothetical protein EI290_02415 [Hymenobacter metallilatus]
METQLDTPVATSAQLLHTIADYLTGPEARTLPNFGVGTGKGGTVLFLCHYAAYTGNTQYYDQALEQLEAALGEMNPQTYKSSYNSNYFQELAELGNLLCYLGSQGHLDWDSELLLSKVDALLEGRLQHHLASKNLEIINGALSVGVYFLRRQRHSAVARRNLLLLLDALEELHEGDEDTGYYWTCCVIQEPRVYTGISHGSAMLISFLAAVYEADVRPQECARLMHYATKFLLRTRMDANQNLSSFPLWQGKEEPTSNLCLLYGDLGTAYAIIRAATILGNSYYLEEATQIALRTTRRTALADTYLYDASLWYGTSGTYLLYAALYRLTRVEEFARAAQFWLEGLPRLATHPNEYLGFSSYFFKQNPAAQQGFNFGVTGIGLTLIQALSKGQYSVDDFIWLS